MPSGPSGPARRRALVCGGSSGIGRAIALHLATRCEDVTVSYASNEKGACEVASAIERQGVRSGTVRLQALDGQGMRVAVREAMRDHERFDIVVNCIGQSRFAAVCGGDFSPALRASFELNVMSLVTLLEELVPPMAERGWGRFVQITSVSARETRPGVGPYAVTKNMQSDIVRFAAREVAERHVCVNAIAPGMTLTPHLVQSNERFAKGLGKTRQEVEEAILAETWTKSMVAPEEIAGCVMFLTSEELTSVVGQTVVIAGGRG